MGHIQSMRSRFQIERRLCETAVDSVLPRSKRLIRDSRPDLRSQYRKSGEPFIIHPVGVASLLGGLKMDVDTVVAGLLHDTVEDTDLTFLQVSRMPWPNIMDTHMVRRATQKCFFSELKSKRDQESRPGKESPPKPGELHLICF